MAIQQIYVKNGFINTLFFLTNLFLFPSCFETFSKDNIEGCIYKYDFNNISNHTIDKSGKNHLPELKETAEIIRTEAGNFLKLDGVKGYLKVPNSKNVHLTNGITLSAIIKLDKVGSLNDEIYDIIFFKENEFLLGIDRGRLYFNFYDGNKWVAKTRGGKIFANAYTHVAVSVQKEKDVAKGKLGYKIVLFVDGEPVAAEIFLEGTPKENNNSIEIGRWRGDTRWSFKGEINEILIYNYGLTEGEIDEIASSSSLIAASQKRLYALEDELSGEFINIEKKTFLDTGKWGLSCMRRAVENMGFSQSEMKKILEKSEKIFLETKNETEFVKYWNNLKLPFEIIETDVLHIMLCKEKISSPIIGAQSRFTGKEIFGARPIAWSISYVSQEDGNKTIANIDKGIDGSITEYKNNPDNIEFIMEWKHHANNVHKFNFKAVSRVKIKGSRIELNITIDNQSPEIRISEVKFPVFQIHQLEDGIDKLVCPIVSGTLVDSPVKKRYSKDGIYPSIIMQFGAYYDTNTGIYFAFEDPLARTKYHMISGKKNILEVSWDSYAGIMSGQKGGNSFSISGNAVIEVFHGDWFDAGQIYKRWLAGNAKWWIRKLPRQGTSEWFRNMCVWTLVERPSDISQIINITKIAESVKAYFDLPMGVFMTGWEDLQKGNMPHFQPKEGIEEIFRRLDAQEIYIMPYLNCRLWNMDDKMFDSHGKSYAAKKPDGTMNYEEYPVDGKPCKFAVMCPASDGWKKWIRDMTMRIASYGCRAQYHDQVVACYPVLCSDASHGHSLAGDEVWLENGYWEMYGILRSELGKKYPLVSLVSEDAVEPYVNIFDGFLPWQYVFNNQIPLFQSIYSGRIQFTGRLFDSQQPGSAESFYIKCAQQLICAEQIGFFTLYQIAVPGTRKLFAKKMAHLRHTLLDWFNGGDMMHPLEFTHELPTITTKWGALETSTMVTTPKLVHSVWKSSTGSIMIVFVNSVNEKVTAEAKLNGRKLGFSSEEMEISICKADSGKSERKIMPISCIQPIELAPLSFEVWLLEPEDKIHNESDKHFQKIVSAINKISHFKMDKFPPEFDKIITARSCLNWFTTDNIVAAIGGSVNRNKKQIGYVQSDCVIYYGLVDFGTVKDRRTLEVEIAVSPNVTGGNIEFMIDSPLNDGKIIAKLESLSSTGGYEKYLLISTTVDENIIGIHKVYIKFDTTGSANLKRWRILKESK